MEGERKVEKGGLTGMEKCGIMGGMNESGHGGKREGAGRPRTLESLQRDKRIVERKLKASAEVGWEVLADAYPTLMSVAVAVAMGNAKEKPNIVMLRTLLELMVKVVGSDAEPADSPIQQLVGKFIARIQESRAPDGPPLDGDSSRCVIDTDSRYDSGTVTSASVPRMASGA